MGELTVVNKSKGSEAERVLAQLGDERLRTQEGGHEAQDGLTDAAQVGAELASDVQQRPNPAAVEQSGPLKATGLLRRKSNTNRR